MRSIIDTLSNEVYLKIGLIERIAVAMLLLGGFFWLSCMIRS